MAFKAMLIVAAWMILSVMAEDGTLAKGVKSLDGKVIVEVAKAEPDDTRVAEVKHAAEEDLQTGEDDLKSEGSALFHSYAPFGGLGYGQFVPPPPPVHGFYGKPYAYGYHHGYHHGFPYFGYGGGYGAGYGGSYGAGYGAGYGGSYGAGYGAGYGGGYGAGYTGGYGFY